MSEAVYQFRRGTLPLLISVPHDGRCLPDAMAARMTEPGRALPDTDWHVGRLYDFAVDFGASVIRAEYSRYVVDLNRPPDDTTLYPGQLATGLCPTHSFAGAALYLDGQEPDSAEQAERVERYWRPYHDKISNELDRLGQQHGKAFLWDAHSIPSTVPRLFDDELPVLNIGANGGTSCAASALTAVSAVAEDSGYSTVVDGRFRGGYITRHFGRPGNRQHALQLELAQRSYMDEATLRYDDERATRLRDVLKAMLRAYLA